VSIFEFCEGDNVLATFTLKSGQFMPLTMSVPMLAKSLVAGTALMNANLTRTLNSLAKRGDAR